MGGPPASLRLNVLSCPCALGSGLFGGISFLFFGVFVMAAPRRVNLTRLPQPAPLHAGGTDLPHPAGLKRTLSARVEVLLFEPDDAGCAEFHYPELTALTGKGGDEDLSLVLEEGEELQDLARMIQKKYGPTPKQRKDRVQDLVDMGYGYDTADSFIDNSEAYDELVPACLTTKYGGFYINVGPLQFRQASGDEHESDDFEENVKPKKRKLKEGGEMKTNKKKKRKADAGPEGEPAERSAPSVDEKQKARKPQNLDGMLRKFHKEKLQELQLFNVKRKASPPAADRAKPVASVMEQDGLSTNEQNQENRGTPAERRQASLPHALPPSLERSLRDLTRGINDSEEGNKMETFAPEINNILLDVSVWGKELSDDMCSRIFSYLSSLMSCNKDTLLQRTRKLRLLQLDDELTVLIRSLEETVLRVMPEQIQRFNDHCQAHYQARAAKLDAVKEKRAVEGSDEEEDESSGKRVFGPRKRFRWNEEIRELLCEVVRLKMSSYELDSPDNQSLEDYLKSFLEASVKTLWPRGWMQSRILLIESRRVHAHVTGVVVRKKSRTVPKSVKGRCGAGVCPGNTGRKVGMPPGWMGHQSIVYTPCGNGEHSVQSEDGVDVQTAPADQAPTEVKCTPLIIPSSASLDLNRGTEMVSLDNISAQKSPPTRGGVSDQKRLPAEEKNPPGLSGDERDVYSPPSRRFSLAVAAMEGWGGDGALPTPSLSQRTCSPRSAPESGTLTSVAPLHALPSPDRPRDGEPAGHTEICRTSTIPGAAPGTFQYTLAHGE